MAKNAYDPDDQGDDELTSPSPSAASDDPVNVPAAARLANPVIRSFDGPAQPAADTVPSDPSAPPPQDSPPTPPAAQPVQAAPAQAPQSYQPSAPAADDDSTSSAPAAPPSDNDLVADYFARQKADLRAHKATGGQTEVLPITGAEVPKRDDDGNLLYHPAVVQPLVRGDDGTAYRVSRDQYGNQHYFDIAQGQEGQDYHLDQNTGEKWVPVSGADGGSKREVIGQDPLVPQITALKSQLQKHTTTASQADLDISQATDGVQGGGELAAASLSDLRDQAAQASKTLKPLQQQLSDLSSYTPDDDQSAAAPADVQAKQQLQDKINFAQQRLDAVQNEVDARDSIIADAKQRRDGLAQQRLDTGTQLAVLQRVRQMGGLDAVQGDLHTIANGGALVDPNMTGDATQSRWKALASMGLVNEEPTNDGTGTALKVTPLGVSMLDDDMQSAVKADPGKFAVTSNAPATPAHVQRAVGKLADMADTTPPDPNTTAPVPGSASQPTGAATSTAPDQSQDQPSKPYSVGQDGKLQLDPARITEGLTTAAKDGVISQQQMSQAMPDAQRAQNAITQGAKYSTQNPTLGDQLKGLGTGILQGITSGIGTLVRSPIGQGVIGLGDVLDGRLISDAMNGKFDSNVNQKQADAAGNWIQHSTDGLNNPALKDTIGAKAGGFVGGVIPYVAAGFTGPAAPAVLGSMLFGEGYQNQYESAKAKLTEAAQKTGQPIDPEHVENAAKGAGLLGGAINTILALPFAGASSAITKVFGGVERSSIAQGMVNAFENDGVQGIMDAFSSIGKNGVTPEVEAALEEARAAINKTVGARIATVARTAATNSAIGAAVQVGQNVVAQNLYDPNRGLFDGVPAQAIAFGALGAAHGTLRQVALAGEAAKARGDADAGNASQGPTDEGGGLILNGDRPTGPTPHPADLAKPVAGKVVDLSGEKPVEADRSQSRASSQSPATPVSAGAGDPSPQAADSAQKSASPADPASVPAQVLPAARGALATSAQPSSASAQPANPAPAGQAQPSAQDDKRPPTPAADPQLAEMIQKRDGMQQLLDAGKVSPEAEDATRGLVDVLSKQITAAQRSGSTAAPAAVAPDAPTSTSHAGQRPAPVDASAKAGGTLPAPPADGTRTGEGAVSATPRADNSTPADAHHALADLVNSGATTDNPDGPASLPFQVLSRLKAMGNDVTLATADAVTAHISDIMAEPPETRQSALRELVRSHLAGDDTTNAAATEPPSSAPTAPPMNTRQPVTAAGQEAGRTIAGLTARQRRGEPMTDLHHNALDEARHTVDRDLNQQVLGPEARPTTKAGQQALDFITKMQSARDNGAYMGKGEYDNLHAAHRKLQADYTVQRQAIEAREASSPAQPASVPAAPTPFEHAAPAVKQAAHEKIQARKAVGRPATPSLGALASADLARLNPEGRARFLATAAAADAEHGLNLPARGIHLSAPAATTTADSPATGQPAPRIEVPPGPGDKPSMVKARTWIADQRQASVDFKTLPDAVAKQFGLGIETARTLVAQQAAAEQTATQQSRSSSPAPSQSSPATPSSTPTGSVPKSGDVVTYQGRRAIVEKVEGNTATIRVQAGPSPANPNVNLLAKRVPGVSLDKLAQLAKPTAVSMQAEGAAKTIEKLRDLENGGATLDAGQLALAEQARAAVAPGAKQPAYLAGEAKAAAEKQIQAHGKNLLGMGIERVFYGPVEAGSGIALADDGTLRIDPTSLAKSMTTVARSQAKLGIQGTPGDWFKQLLVAHESGHAADVAVARAKGQTVEERYNGLPDEALPKGLEAAARKAYGTAQYDALPRWKQKAEGVRMIYEQRWTGKITEALYKFVKEALDFLKGVAGLKDADPILKTHVEEVERHVEAMRAAANASPIKAPRSFEMPYAPTGNPDVLDYVKEQGGIVSKGDAKDRPTYDKMQGDYDGAPALGGFYHHAVFGGRMMPDRMAQILHENYGVGDGSVDGMWNAISQARELRSKVRAQQQNHALAEKQSDRFDKDALTPATAKGKTEVNTGNLSVGDKVQIGNQTLSVVGIDPDTMDVELEDHSRYGVQHVADNTALYVEKVTPAATGEGSTLAAARPDTLTGNLFGDDEPFDLRGEAAPDLDRIAAAKQQAQAPARTSAPAADSLPTLRPGERQGDLLSRQSEDLHLVGERGIDHGARQAAQAQAQRESDDARAKQDREQGSLFTPAATEPLRYPPELLAGGDPQTRRADLVREAYAAGELSRSPETGLWARGAKTARTARELVTPDERTVAERRTILENDKAQLRTSYQRAGQSVPENMLAERENALAAREKALARFEPSRSGASTGSTLAAAEPEEANDPAPAELRDTRVPVPQAVFDQLGIQRGNVFADYANLARKHPEYFPTSQDAKNYVEHVMARPTEILPGNRPDHRLVVRSNGGHKSVALEVELRGGKYRVRSAHTLTDQQMAAKRIAAGPGATLGVSRVDPKAGQETPSRSLDTSRNAPPVGEQNVTTSPAAEQPTRRGSTQLTLAPRDAKPIQNYVRAIPEHILYSEKGATGREKYGRELEPHVTSLYGLTGEGDTPGAVAQAVRGHGPATVTLGKLSLFSNPDAPYDVLKADVDSPDLHALNASLRDLPHQNDYPDYHPHMTLAYLKKGMGAPYVGKNPFGDRQFTFESLTHSSATKQRTEIPLDRGASATTAGHTLAAAEPDIMDDDESAAPGEATAPATGLLNRAKKGLADYRQQRDQEQQIRGGKYAAETRAGISGEQAGEAMRLYHPDALDQRAAVPVVEAGGNRAALEAQLAKVKSSVDPQLAEEYAPVYQHALDNLDRLHAANQGFRDLQAGENSDAQKAGIERTPWQPYVEHVLDDADLGRSIVKDKGLAQVPGHSNYADAIHAGVDPKGMNLPDVAQRMVRRNREAINTADFLKTVGRMKARDGKPVLDAIKDSGSTLDADGTVSSSATVPKGYEAVQAGPNVLVVHKQFSPLFKAMYGESAVRQNGPLHALLKTAGFAKRNTLVFESYHLFRMGGRAALGYGITGYKDDLAGLKYRLEDLDLAVKAGAISKEQADAVRENYAVDDKLLRAGLPVGKFADNLAADPHLHGLFEKLPVIGPLATRFNKWMFNEVQRSYIRQAGRIAYERVKARSPGMSDDAVVRQAVRETGNFFGNPASTSFLTSRTMEDAANIIGFSPKWTEGTLKSELEGFAQAAKIPVDLLRGRRPQVGNSAQALATVLLGSVIGTQLLNLFTRGKTTFQNPEEDHHWDAWIPGGADGRGFFFSPLSIAAEFTHGLHKYMAAGENPLDATVHIASNKLSGPARGVKDLVTGADWHGQPFASMGERLKAAAVDTLPLPLPASGTLEKNPKAPFGYSLNHQPGSYLKQGLSMLGLKVDNTQSARAQVYRLAQPYRANQGGGAHAPSAYGDLRHLLDNNDLRGAAGEMQRLVATGHDVRKISQALGIHDDGTIRPEMFTGSRATEKKMLDHLSVDQRRVYYQAQKEHSQIAQRFRQIGGRVASLSPVGS